jgi:hypothetical protein
LAYPNKYSYYYHYYSTTTTTTPLLLLHYHYYHHRFLTMSPAVFDRVYSDCRRPPPQWAALHLSTSYRVTRSMAAFINEGMLGRAHITSYRDTMSTAITSNTTNTTNTDTNNDINTDINNDMNTDTDANAGRQAEHPVLYLIGSQHEAARLLAREIAYLLRPGGGVRPRDVFVLGASMKSDKTGAGCLARLLAERGIRVSIAGQDGAGAGGESTSIGDNDSDDSVSFCTFHQSKGLERKYVFIFGFDKSYFRFYDTASDPSVCPCPLYVAATRASEYLCLVATEEPSATSTSTSTSGGGSGGGEHLPFLRRAQLARLDNGPVHIYSVDSVMNYQPIGKLVHS